MWNFIVLSAILCGVSYARPQSNDPSVTPIPIVTQFSNNSPDGSFNTSYETGNGIKVQNAGYIKRITVPKHEDENGRLIEQHDEDIVVQVGSFSYTDTDGNHISLSYIADENGFQPTGDHLPKVPESNPGEGFAKPVQRGQQQGRQLSQQQEGQQPDQGQPIQ